MKFTLLMPTLCRKSLDEAVSAVLGQTYRDWELLIAPAYHLDLTVSDPRIRILPRSSWNLSEVLNDMVSVASGEVFAVAADDDILEPMALSAVATYLRSNRPWLVGRIRTNGHLRGGRCTLPDMLDANHLPCPAVFWRRGAAVRTGGFNPEHEFCFDYDYWIRMWKAVGPPVFIEHVLSWYSDHSGQVSHMVAEAVHSDGQKVKEEHANRIPE